MEIAVDRYLDDGRTLLVTLALRSRTTEMHSALTALDPEQREAVHDEEGRPGFRPGLRISSMDPQPARNK